MEKSLPAVPLSDCPKSYAECVGEGFDYWQEALSLQPIGSFCSRLEQCRCEAANLSLQGDATVPLTLGAETFQVASTGAKGGVKWRLGNDDFLLLIGSPQREWTISIRYLAAGLWEHGVAKLRERALKALWPVTRNPNPADYVRVTRIDWCWDFFSPAFTDEFRPGLSAYVVMPSAAKHDEYVRIIGSGRKGQTMSLGGKGLEQVQLYDKTREIFEASGKEWLFKLWRENAGWPLFAEYDRPRHVWRLECRWSRDWLRERNLRRIDEALPNLKYMIAEALYERRLTVPNGDSNERRWPLHPLWSEAARRSTGEFMVARGRLVTGRRNALLDNMTKQIAGSMLATSMLKHGELNAEFVGETFEKAMALMLADPKHAQKVKKLRHRYSQVDDAR